MLFEYAVEPKLVGSSWANARYWLEKFGFDRGRLISKFPNKWQRKVLEAARDAGMGDVHYKSLVEKLSRATQDAIASFDRHYDPQLGSWIENALHEHNLRPFHAIVVSSPCDGRLGLLACDEVDETHDLMVASTNREVPRTGSDLARAMSPLLRTARRVKFVDPFFDIRDARFRETLKHCLSVLAESGHIGIDCEVHFREHDSRPPTDFVIRNAPTWLSGVIPPGMSLTLLGWNEKLGGADFHARYILTDRGGMNVEAGFSAEGAHQKVALTLLSRGVWAEKLAAFETTSSIYNLATAILRINHEGQVTRL